jgi:hypothetical protein
MSIPPSLQTTSQISLSIFIAHGLREDFVRAI